MEPQAEQPKSPIEDSVRLLFRQGGYAAAVPVIKEHLSATPDDIPAYELLADALKYAGDKPASAAALSRASELYAQAGMTIQSIAAQKRCMKLGVEPDFSSIRALQQQAQAEAPSSQRMPTPLFDDFSDEEFQEFVERLAVQSYEPGDVVVEEGSFGNSLFVLSSGVLEVVTGKAPAELKLANLAPGDFFGEAALLTGRPRTATIRATAPAECLVLSREDFLDMVTMHPRVQQVMEEFNRRRAQSTIESMIAKRKGE
jgi:hypothetical protein